MSQIKTVKITELKKGESVFKSTGVSKIKVTQNGEVTCLEIPIHSTGISELIDTFQDRAPRPPTKNVLVKPDDEIGREMKLAKNQWMKLPDLTDPEYLTAMDEHNSNLGTAIVMRGIAVDIKDDEGNILTNNQEKIKIMKEMGMSGEQFSQIVEDITSLTRWSEEEKEAFLG